MGGEFVRIKTVEGRELVISPDHQVAVVQSETVTGVYAPCTAEGTVVVNGIGCSCYAAVQHEDAHKKMQYINQPLSLFPSTANRGCHGVVGCLRMRVPRKLILAKDVPFAPASGTSQVQVV